jgi:hypothetical protein
MRRRCRVSAKRVVQLAGCLGAIGLAFALVGCGGTTSPSGVQWTGTWKGTVNDASAGAGALTMTLNQSNSRVTGTARITVLGTNIEGPVDGTVSDKTIDATATSPAPLTCTLSFHGDRSGNTVTGQYAASVCLLPVSGTFSMSLQ